MMSISSVSSAGDASQYYEVDDYYTKDNADQHTQASEWHGNGAVLQGLSGAVKPEDFHRVMDGVTADGTELGRYVDGERQHRSGLDLTFTPPKSVAIMAQVFGDKKVEELHKDAVKQTLNLIEKVAAQGRVTAGGVTQKENTSNLTIALFNHTSTRAQDPGMHTHAVIANMTLDGEGKWRSLSNEAIWENSKAKFGEYYSMVLAHSLHERGYDIVSRGKNAEYEIGGVSSKLIDEFSTRSKDIKKLLEERGLAGPANREWAAKATRDNKVTIDKDVERKVWQERAASKGVDHSNLITEANERALNRTSLSKEEIALDGVRTAMDMLSQRSSHFTLQSLVQTSRNILVGQVRDSDISQAVTALKEQQVLLQPNQHESTLTTRETVAIENDNLLKVELGKGTQTAILSADQAKSIASRFTLNPGQTNSLVMAATSKDRVNSIQGWAGVGKTHFAVALNEMLTSKGYVVEGLSPSAQAAAELQKGSGIESNTLASFIFRHENGFTKNDDGKPKYIVIDEASFVSSKDYNKVLDIAERTDARILKIGDYKQLGAVDAGAPHKQTLDSGITKSEITDIVRQRNNPVLREAIYATINNNVEAALDRITIRENEKCVDFHSKIEESGGAVRFDASYMRRELSKQAAERYTSLSPLERANTALIVQNNDARNQVNAQVRSVLVERGEIGAEGITVTSLKNKGLTDGELRLAQSYDPGDVVRFNTQSQHFGIEAKEYFTVSSNATLINSDRYVTLVSSTDPTKEVTIHPKELASRGDRGIDVFKASEREIAPGDVLRWTQNDKQRDIVNTQTATVLSVNQESKQAEVLLANNEARVMDMRDPKNNHFDYNFANTAHSLQGATVQNVIAVGESWHKLLTNMRSFYVQISRATDNVELITDSAGRIQKALEHNTAKEDIALDMYSAADKPLDFDVLKEVKDTLISGHDLKDIYVDLVRHFDGDRLAAQQHLNELGADLNRIEQGIVIDHAMGELERAEAPIDDLNMEMESEPEKDDELTDIDIQDNQADTSNQEPVIDWVNFDEHVTVDEAQSMNEQDLDEMYREMDL